MLTSFLDSLPDLGAWPQGSMRSSDFTLERMQPLMAALGQPQQSYASIHVAGTNGKGSVCAFCEGALAAAGYCVGLYTSPHLRSPLNGIAVNGEIVGEEQLEATFQAMRPCFEARDGWTQFEAVTALAYQHFAEASVQVAVIEVGLGGRLDATNLLVPTVSVITPIDYDHTSILGDQLGQIASEKAGIIKRGVPVVTAPQVAEARREIVAAAEKNKAPLVEVGVDYLFETIKADLSGQEFRVWPATQPERKVDLRIALLGAHQVENAATAFAALRVAGDRDLKVDENTIREGFASARWPARFEVLQTDPALVLDAAHSPHAARALRRALDDYFPGKGIILVLGVSADKDLGGIVEALRPRISQVVATQSAQPRAMAAKQLQSRLAALGLQGEAQPDAARALQIALRLANPDKIVLVCGSVFLVEWVREAYFQTKGSSYMR